MNTNTVSNLNEDCKDCGGQGGFHQNYATFGGVEDEWIPCHCVQEKLWHSIDTAPKNGLRIVLSDGERAEDGIWHTSPFPNWYHHVWVDGGTQGLCFIPTCWAYMPEVSCG